MVLCCRRDYVKGASCSRRATRTDVHAGRNQIGRGEMAQIVGSHSDAALPGETGRYGGDGAGLDRLRPGRVEALPQCSGTRGPSLRIFEMMTPIKSIEQSRPGGLVLVLS